MRSRPTRGNHPSILAGPPIPCFSFASQKIRRITRKILPAPHTSAFQMPRLIGAVGAFLGLPPIRTGIAQKRPTLSDKKN